MKKRPRAEFADMVEIMRKDRDDYAKEFMKMFEMGRSSARKKNKQDKHANTDERASSSSGSD